MRLPCKVSSFFFTWPFNIAIDCQIKRYIASLEFLINWRLPPYDNTGDKEMNVSRKIGIVVFCMVPAIIGGGIVYAIFNSYMPVFIYELLLLFGAGAFVSR